VLKKNVTLENTIPATEKDAGSLSREERARSRGQAIGRQEASLLLRTSVNILSDSPAEETVGCTHSKSEKIPSNWHANIGERGS